MRDRRLRVGVGWVFLPCWLHMILAMVLLYKGDALSAALSFMAAFYAAGFCLWCLVPAGGEGGER